MNIEDIEKVMATALKDIICPHCKKIVILKVLLMSDCEVSNIKYKVKCSECKKSFETGWRKYLSQKS